MALPKFGITFRRDDNEVRPTIGSDLSVIGLIGTAPLADGSAFPLNQAVAMFSSDSAALTALGATGTLPDALRGINDQLSDFEVSARVVVVRVAEGVDDDATIANILGNEGARTGIYAFLDAGPDLAVIPRLIGVPGYTHQHEHEDGETTAEAAVKTGGNTGNGTITLADPAYGGAVKAGTYLIRATGGTFAAVAGTAQGAGDGVLTVADPSTGNGVKIGVYRATCIAEAGNGGTFQIEDPDGITIGVVAVGDAFDGVVKFTIADGADDFELGDFFEVTVGHAIPEDGGVFSVTDPDGVTLAPATVGVPYDTAHLKFTIADGGTDFVIGDGFDVDVTIDPGVALANPICAALPSVLDRLLAHAIVEGPGTTDLAITNWRETMSSERLIPIDCWVRVSVNGVTVTRPGVGRVLGLAAATDYQGGGIPSRSFANRPIRGILGWARNIDFSLTDGDSQGQVILANNVGIGVRGEMGVESAAGSSGFIFIGTDNAGTDALWQFYSTTRMRDYIHLGLLKTLRQRLGRTNINLRSIDVVLDDVRFFLRDLAADQRILADFRVSFDVSRNSPEDLRLGIFKLYFQCEEAPPLVRIDVDSRRYRPALERMLDSLLSNIPPEQATAA